MSFVYLNHAATSFPKPPEVLDAVAAALASPPADPGRGGLDSDTVEICRRRIAELFGLRRPEAVSIQPSATHALNAAILGLLEDGGHAVTTPLEHTSVLRPLHHLAAHHEVACDFVEPRADGRLEPLDIARAVIPSTRLVVVCHAANSTGVVQPVEEIADAVAGAGVALLVDASQTAGVVGLRMNDLAGRVLVAVAGHKSLLGPAGTGALLLADDDLPQTVFGGTGVRSESLDHPAELPLRHEAGTPNLPAIAGLSAGLEVVRARGIDEEAAKRNRLVHRLRQRLAAIPEVWLAPLARDDGRAGVVAFNVANWRSEDLAFALHSAFSIVTRGGLHCAPLAHRFLGLFPEGTLRASFGWSSTEDDADALADAVARIVRGGHP